MNNGLFHTSLLHRLQGGMLPGEPFFYAGLWLAPNIGMRFNQHHLPLSAIMIVACLGIAWLAGASRAKRGSVSA